MKNYTMEENIEDSKKLQKMFDVINLCPVPTVGVVHGAALGGGAGLVSCLDYVIAEENTKFGFTEVKLGLLPAVISPYVMDKIGLSLARAMFTTGERFMASRALEIGLVHRVETTESIEERLQKVKKQFLTAGPESSRVAKTLAFKINDASKSMDQKAVFTRELIAKTRVGNEAQEGMQAMLEKEKRVGQNDDSKFENKKILIANRGEIVKRVALSAKQLGIQTLALYIESEKVSERYLFIVAFVTSLINSREKASKRPI